MSVETKLYKYVVVDGNKLDVGGNFSPEEIRSMLNETGMQKNVMDSNFREYDSETLIFENLRGSNGTK